MNVDDHGSIRDVTPDPESAAIASANGKLALRILRSIPERDREILIRFYLKEQSAEEVCRKMELTQTQFRLIKSRAKARFGQLGKCRWNCGSASLLISSPP
jgi:RNA polymerase sigma-70 factor, ECF subfamily